MDDPRLALYFEVYDFGSGCICCSPDGDLTRALCSIGNERENAQSQLSHLIIESTGIADPRPFSRLLSTNEDITRHFRLDAVVAVLTAAPGRPVESLPNVERVRRIQIENSDCVLFRKVDLLDPQTRERVLEDERAQASRLNARLHILDAPPGAPISWPDLTARPRPAPGDGRSCGACDDEWAARVQLVSLSGHDQSFQTACVVESGGVILDRFVAWLDGLLAAGASAFCCAVATRPAALIGP